MAWDEGDQDRVLALCPQDVVFIGSGEGEDAQGRRGLVTMVEALQSHADGVEFTVDFTDTTIDILGDVALITARGAMALVGPRTHRQGPYRLTAVLVRREGSWRWKSHHGSEPISW